jgi:pimeloyl-ACP methyl ester carboxylesterase
MRVPGRLQYAAVSAALVGALTSPGVAGAAPAKVAWSTCHADLGPFECGTVQVPLDHGQPNGGKISLALVRLPATDPARRIGSLFLNPGGPGGSGVDFALFAGPALLTPEVRARFDLVGFDPRGVLRSSPLRCFGTPQQWQPYFTPFAFPSTPAEEATWITADRYFTAACAQRSGRIAEHMATADVARDLDLLRQAVGDQRLTYAGYSYGSYLGVTYANLFPGRVRALVVDGVLDPIAWATGRGDEGTRLPFAARLGTDRAARATLGEFFRLCDAGGSACAFSGGAAARFASLAARLRAAPFDFTLPDGSVARVDYSVLIAATFGALYDSAGWEDFAQLLADVETQAGSAALVSKLQRLAARPALVAPRGFPRYPNVLESTPGIACTDTDNPDHHRAWSDAVAASDAPFGRYWIWTFSSLCAEWPFADAARYTGPFTATTTNPGLVVGTRFDPATSYAGATTVADLLPNARLLTVDGWGHTSLFLSRCADDAVARYLTALELPRRGAVCAQDHVPFTGATRVEASPAAIAKHP